MRDDGPRVAVGGGATVDGVTDIGRKIREYGEEGYAAFVDEDDYHLRKNG